MIAIKTTVYRTSDDSTLVSSLIDCAEQGKQSVCLVELKARFDERRNIEWSRAMEQAGVHVVHGFADLKIHAKMTLVVRREEGSLRRYVHIGTGNYNAATARLYEDVGLFTADEEIAADVADLFNHLTGFGRPQRFRKLLVAPFAMRSELIDEIRRVAAAAAAGERTRIRLKLNQLVDPTLIEELYAASQAGVQIEICARAICMLRPGVKGMSENVRVRSIFGRFLEHSRIYSFEAGDEVTSFIGSADLMPRNLDRRIEVLAPVEAAGRARSSTPCSTASSPTRRTPGSSRATAAGRGCAPGGGRSHTRIRPRMQRRARCGRARRDGRVARPVTSGARGHDRRHARRGRRRRLQHGTAARRGGVAGREVTTVAKRRAYLGLGDEIARSRHACAARRSTGPPSSPARTRLAREYTARTACETIVTAPGRQGRSAEPRSWRSLERGRLHPCGFCRRTRRDASPSTARSHARRMRAPGVVGVVDVGGGSTELVVGTPLLGPTWVTLDRSRLAAPRATRPSRADPPTRKEIREARDAAPDAPRRSRAAAPRPRAGVRDRWQRTRRRARRRAGVRRRAICEEVARIAARRTASKLAKTFGLHPHRARTVLAGALLLAEASRAPRPAAARLLAPGCARAPPSRWRRRRRRREFGRGRPRPTRLEGPACPALVTSPYAGRTSGL